MRGGRTGAAWVSLGSHSHGKASHSALPGQPRHRDICAVFLAAQLCLNEPDWA